MTSKVWVKLRGSNYDAFRVEIAHGALIDDLKDAISAKKKVEVEFIYSGDVNGENIVKYDPTSIISTLGQTGSRGDNPYYYTIVPAVTPQPGKYSFPMKLELNLH